MILDITAFDSVTIVTTSRVMTSMVETFPTLSRMGVMENGAIFDADGTADGDVVLGQVTATYKLVPASTAGMTAMNTLINEMRGLRGKEGTLTGVERAASPASKTCTARCIDVIQEEVSVRNAPPMNAKYRQRVYMTVVWQKKTEWA